MRSLEVGATMVIISIPHFDAAFSDPIADGPVIQEANIRSLSAGCTMDGIFEVVISIREKTEIPLVFLAYLNTLWHGSFQSQQ